MNANWKNVSTWETVRFTMVFGGVKAVFTSANGRRRMRLFNSVSEALDFVKSDSSWREIV